MRKIKYKLIPDVAGSFLEKEEPLSAFVRDIHGVFVNKNIPPLTILNEALAGGYSPREAEWEPFEISETEYKELVNDLLANPSDMYKHYQEPNDIKTFSQWLNWLQSIGY